MKSKNAVLVVEDEPMLRQIIQDTLEDEGLQVYSAENGTAALNRLMHATDIALVVSDIKMSPMGGVELRRMANDLPETNRPLYWVALTAHFSAEAERAELMDFDDTFFKPCSTKMLALFAKKVFDKLKSEDL